MPSRAELIAIACYAAGCLLMLAMAFAMLPRGWALFLGASAFTLGGLVHGLAQPVRALDPSVPPPFQPTVSRREV